MAGYPAKSALKIKFLPEFRAFNYQIHESSIRRHISRRKIGKIQNRLRMVWTGRYWKKYICPHPLKFSNFFHDNRPDIRYPACRISGTCNRISGRIPDSKKGRISGRPDIRCNPNWYWYWYWYNTLRVPLLCSRFMIWTWYISIYLILTSIFPWYMRAMNLSKPRQSETSNYQSAIVNTA